MNLRIKETLCIKCGASIASLEVCHACDYTQDSIYEEEKENLNMDDYTLSRKFYPNLVHCNPSLIEKYATDIRNKLITFEGRELLRDCASPEADLGYLFGNYCESYV